MKLQLKPITLQDFGMATKQAPGCLQSPDGSYYVTLTDGVGNLVTAGGGSSTIAAGTTATSGITTGDLISSTSNLVADSGIAASSLNQTAGQVLYGGGATGPTSDASFTKVAGTSGVVTLSNSGNSIPQITFAPNSGSNVSLGMANSGGPLLIFTAGTAVTALSGKFQLNNGGGVTWSNSTSPNGTLDCSIYRQTIGVLEIGNGPQNASGSLLLTNLTASGIITVPGAASPILTMTTTVTSGAGASTGTLTNAPAATNPTKWIPINDAGTTRYIPAW